MLEFAQMFSLVRLFALAAVAIVAQAQTITATLTGTVRDPQGAAVPRATLTVTSADTSQQRTASSDREGRYSIPFLQPGTYSIAVTAKGFGKLTRSEIRLEVAQVAEVDLALPIDVNQQTVEVREDAPALVTETSSIETTVENKLIMELPSGERSTLSFLNLIPGAIDGGFALATGENLNTNGNAQGPIGTAGNRNFFDSNFSVSGGQASTNDVLLDGVSDTVGDFNGVAVSPPQDSVREFKVMTGGFSSEYGRTGGAVVNFVTKAGTERFHGSLYEYFQNGALNANGWQRNRRGLKNDGTPALPRIPIKRNQFGVALGGPVKLPKVGTAKSTFFFFNYEGRREANPFSKQLTMPSEKMHKGDLSELLTGAVRPNLTNADGSPALFGQVYSPFGALTGGKRQVIPGNRLDLLPTCPSGPRTAACLDPVGLKLLSYLPLPNQPGLDDNYVYSGTAHFQRDLLAGRLDRQLTQNHSMFARISKEDRYQAEPNFLNSIASNSRTINDTFYNVTFNEVWLARPSVISNFRYGYTRAHAHQVLLSEGTDPADTLGLPAYIAAAGPIPSFPIFNFSGGPEGQGIPGEITSSQISGGGNNQPRDTQTLADTVSIIRGPHTIRAGGEYRLYRFFANQYNNPDGTFSFNRTFTRGPTPGSGVTNVQETGSSMASLLMGLPSGISKENVIPLTLYHHYGALFLQDDWRASGRLTLNLGLRWDVETATAETHRQVTSFDPDAPSPLAGKVADAVDPAVRLLRGSYKNLPGLLSFPQGPQTATSWRRFAPRIGAAYRLNNKTALRASYAMFYVPISVEQGTALGNVFTTTVSQSDNTTQVIQPGGTAAPTVLLTNPFPGGLPAPPGNSQGAYTLMGQAITIATPSRPKAYNQQWNFVVQRQLVRNMIVDVAYVGSHGLHLPAASLALNQLPPEYLDFARANFAQYRDVNGVAATSPATFFSAQVANPFAGVIDNPNSNLRNPTVTRLQLLTPFPQYTGVTDYRPHVGSLSYNGLQVSLQKRFSRGVSATANYVWSKSIDTGGPGNNSGQGTTVENIYNIAQDRSISRFDVPHRFVLAGVWEMPFLSHSKAVLPRLFLRGWQTSGTYVWQRGTPISVTTSSGISGNFAVRRPDRIAGSDASFDIGTARRNAQNGLRWFDTAAFVNPPEYRMGTAARTYADVRRDNYRNINLSLARNFVLHEQVRLQFRCEFLNVLNQVIFGTPGTDVATPSTFGFVTTQGNTPRNIQMVLRVTF
jgi:outer membrane receptor protein involved in Fe transport